MLRSSFCDYSDKYIVVKGRTAVKTLIMLTEEMKNKPLRIMLRSDHAYQKLITHL